MARGRDPEIPPTVRFTLAIPTQIPPTEFGPAIALSPKGDVLVFVGQTEGTTRLFLRTLNQITTRELEGTDGQRVAFTAPSPTRTSLSLYDIPSKTFSRLTYSQSERPAWSPDGRWVGYSGTQAYRVATDGSGVVDTLALLISPPRCRYTRNNVFRRWEICGPAQ